MTDEIVKIIPVVVTAGVAAHIVSKMDKPVRKRKRKTVKRRERYPDRMHLLS